ncbi:short-chain dehydrogenase/reductase [Micromonospora acroterricola]|uniref:Short-chain dehydrogenase/reductase n=1 Tax=Micromonospora acroterricola TaxID=2202421 RepID=A0A317D861_9ACTN|nr:oxidoreductase [Micromonospora acroterricola]PWR11038.1 short-chain dehydrogenase/reductase [Micromonospora acroterricola]
MSKTWLITGSSVGLGRHLVEVALAAGDNVVATSRTPEQLADLAQRHGDRLLAVGLDVTDPADSRAVVNSAVERFGSLDVVVNNAGYATTASAEDFPEDEFRRQVETNLFGVINVTRAALPVMRRQRSGHLIQISSIGGRVGGTAGLSAYQTAKYGVEGYSAVVASEVAPLGITVTIVEPGGLRTNWAGGAAEPAAPVREEYDETVGARLRMLADYTGNEPGDPARAAEAIVEIAATTEPPLRLLIGSDALRIALDHSRNQIAEAEEWADLTSSVDFAAAA